MIKKLMSILLVVVFLVSGFAAVVQATELPENLEIMEVLEEEEEATLYRLEGLYGASSWQYVSGGATLSQPNGSYPINDGAVNPETTFNGGVSYVWVYNADGYSYLSGSYYKMFEVRYGTAIWFPSP